MKQMLRNAALVVATLLPVHTFAATTGGTDFSDLWWNPAESGWGANIAHQGDTIFMTLFVYGADNKVRWYVAPSAGSQSGSDTYAGVLYEASGPYIGRAFNPSEVSVRPVGTARLTFPAGLVAQLQYDVDGVSQNKSIQRQTFRANDLSGSYYGAMVGDAVNCPAGSGAITNAMRFTVNHFGDSIDVASFTSNSWTCTYSGTYTQSGRMGSVEGTISCANDQVGTFRMWEIEAGESGFNGHYQANYGGGCIKTGRIGAVR